MSSSLPVFIEFNKKYLPMIFSESSKIGALYLIASSKSDKYSSLKELGAKMAKKNKGKILTIIMDSEDEFNQRFMDILGAKKDDIPLMRFAYGWQRKYMPKSSGITEDKINQF